MSILFEIDLLHAYLELINESCILFHTFKTMSNEYQICLLTILMYILMVKPLSPSSDIFIHYISLQPLPFLFDLSSLFIFVVHYAYLIIISAFNLRFLYLRSFLVFIPKYFLADFLTYWVVTFLNFLIASNSNILWSLPCTCLS